MDQQDSSLLQVHSRIAEFHQPEILFLENVKNYVSHNQGRTLATTQRLLDGVGYDPHYSVINASLYGVPQKRERVIIIGNLNGKRVPYLKPTHDEEGLFNLPKWISFREATRGLKEKDMNYIKFPEKRLKFYKELSKYVGVLPGKRLKSINNEKKTILEKDFQRVLN